MSIAADTNVPAIVKKSPVAYLQNRAQVFILGVLRRPYSRTHPHTLALGVAVPLPSPNPPINKTRKIQSDQPPLQYGSTDHDHSHNRYCLWAMAYMHVFSSLLQLFPRVPLLLNTWHKGSDARNACTTDISGPPNCRAAITSSGLKA